MGETTIWVQGYVNLAVLLLGALPLVVPTGYSVGAVLLLLGSAVLLVQRPRLGLSYQDWLIIAAMAFYAVVGMGDAWWGGASSREMDKPVRFLLAIPAMLLVMAYPPRRRWLWVGLALGATGAGALGGWQFFIEGVSRASGLTQAIQFGNLALLLGFLCVAGMGWAWAQPQRRFWLALLLLGALGGVAASLLSGSRGGWVGLPLILWVLYRGYGREFALRWRLAAVMAVVLAAGAVYATPQLGVQGRVDQAVTEFGGYLRGEDRTSSVGVRFEMWKGAARIGWENPVLGVGIAQFESAMGELAEQGVIVDRAKEFGHAHNEFLDTWAKRGALGLAALLIVYLVPIRLFANGINHPDLQIRSLAVAGTLLPVAFIDFGLTQGFFSHNSGVMVYAFWLAVLWGSFSMRLKVAGRG
ncbi:O-antigen ligase family protein [Halomonas sp. NO4]|uniref:O-antigen ligase family protein n=1 Tax=Halomonas sp. NO4 TaxID=2484813 RepID=UPI0013CFE08F|nr:O-antigen ligase family protein [Halomonas sp. NO4]